MPEMNNNNTGSPFIADDALFRDPRDSGLDEELQGIFNSDDNIEVLRSSSAQNGESEDIPLEMVTILKEHGFGDAGDRGSRRSSFRIWLKQVKDNDNECRWPILGHYRTRQIPTIQHVMEKYGSGNYVFVINWEEKDPETKKRYSQMKYVHFSISEKIEEERKWKRYEEYIEKAKKLKEKARQSQVEEEIFDSIGLGKTTQQADPKKDFKEQIKELAEMQQLIAGSMGQTQNNSSTNWAEIIKSVLPLLIPTIPGILSHFANRANQQQERFEKLMFLLLSNKEDSHRQMLEMMKGTGNNSQQFMEVMNVARQMIGFKKEMEPEKESILDKVMEMVQSVGPVLIQLLRMPRPAQQMAGVTDKINDFKQNEDIQAIINDREMFSEMVNRLDNHFGNQSDTDAILNAIDMTRPGNEVETFDGSEPENQRTEEHGEAE